MKKLTKKIVAIVLAGAMLFSVGSSVFAEAESALAELGNAGTKQYLIDGDTITIPLSYTNGNKAVDSVSPKQDLQLTITNYGLWNVGENGLGSATYTTSNMPLPTVNGNISLAEGAADNSTVYSWTVTLPSIETYGVVGDYWYQVVETQVDNNEAGVIIGTNDSQSINLEAENNGHNATYYMHVQICYDTNNFLTRTVTLHQTAPNPECTNKQYEAWYASEGQQSAESSKKVASIANEYYAGQLVINKEVTGNAGDVNELFGVTVKFFNESGKTVGADVTCDGALSSAGTDFDDNTKILASDLNTATKDNPVERTFYIKNNRTVTFSNLPYGIGYVVTETQPNDDKYTNTFGFKSNTSETLLSEQTNGTFDKKTYENDEIVSDTNWTNDKSSSGTTSAKYAKGYIVSDKDEIVITNDKNSIIDIGVVVNNAPYVAIIALVLVASFFFVRRRMIEG